MVPVTTQISLLCRSNDKHFELWEAGEDFFPRLLAEWTSLVACLPENGAA